jgi:hypothetical protein
MKKIEKIDLITLIAESDKTGVMVVKQFTDEQGQKEVLHSIVRGQHVGYLLKEVKAFYDNSLKIKKGLKDKFAPKEHEIIYAERINHRTSVKDASYYGADTNHPSDYTKGLDNLSKVQKNNKDLENLTKAVK